MKKKRILISRLFMSFVLFGAVLFQVGSSNSTYAAQIESRSLTLQEGTVSKNGGSTPGGLVNHSFIFTLPGGNTVGSIQLQYCTTAAFGCAMPVGLDTTLAGVSLGAQSGVTGFTLNKAVNGTPYLTRSAAAIGSPVTTAYRLDGVKNPTTANQTFFVRISTFASTDTTGTALDTGTVAASTATPIVLTGVMPESLVFCTGETVNTTTGVPDCTTAIGGSINFNQLFSPVATAIASSQMAASTNAGSGYSIMVTGPTLSSGGSNTISPMGAGQPSVLGISQFGLNLATNTTPVVGGPVAPVANGNNYRGQAVTNYNTVNQFKYGSTDVIADSANGGAGGSDAQIFTISYMVNVPGNQPAGTYSTTLTYICTPTF
jgi:hypothetical protein